MKILFDHPNPFLLAHGGLQIQIEQTKSALEKIGLQVEWLRWWDEKQSGNLIHFFGRPSGSYVDFAHQKGMKIVVAELHTGLGSRGPSARFLQKAIIGLSKNVLPRSFTARMAWESYKKADAFVANTSWEKFLIQDMFGADPSKVHVVPNGVEDVFFQKPLPPEDRSKFLVCTATITPRKRVVELAGAAILARVPLQIIGKPYSQSDPYFLRFLDLVQKHPDLLKYKESISDRTQLAKVYRESRGFVLLSSMETRSLSSEEAAAAGCPLLLSDLPWARATFGEDATYCPLGSLAKEAYCLKSFHEKAATFKMATPPLRWEDTARKLLALYRSLLIPSESAFSHE